MINIFKELQGKESVAHVFEKFAADKEKSRSVIIISIEDDGEAYFYAGGILTQLELYGLPQMVDDVIAQTWDSSRKNKILPPIKSEKERQDG